MDLIIKEFSGIDIQFFVAVIIRLLVACILGGIIGFERENLRRPAGFRTHVLVCVGAALVMVTSEYIFNKFGQKVNVDPSRLGAQVISGIGFLGAGTIMREGFTVKGLTTAASLWAVSCVGIASGIGFYEGAVFATIMILLTLFGLKRVEDYFTRRNNYFTINIETANISGLFGEIYDRLAKFDTSVKNVEFLETNDESYILVRILLRAPSGVESRIILENLAKIEGIRKVYL